METRQSKYCHSINHDGQHCHCTAYNNIGINIQIDHESNQIAYSISSLSESPPIAQKMQAWKLSLHMIALEKLTRWKITAPANITSFLYNNNCPWQTIANVKNSLLYFGIELFDGLPQSQCNLMCELPSAVWCHVQVHPFRLQYGTFSCCVICENWLTISLYKTAVMLKCVEKMKFFQAFYLSYFILLSKWRRVPIFLSNA